MPKSRHPYEDVIHLPHHVSKNHRHMSPAERAAQFSPFAALTGFDAEVREAARLTNQKIELTEEQQAILDERLRLLEDIGPGYPAALFTYFKPDIRKDGGSYISITGHLRKLDRIGRNIILADGSSIPVDDLLEVDGPLWNIFGD